MIIQKEPFKERLNQIMMEKGTRAVDLAKAIGVSEGTISQYRSGYSAPKRDRLTQIANYFNVSATWLMGIEDVEIESHNIYTDENAATLARLTRYTEYFSTFDKFVKLSERDKQTVSALIDTLSK